MAEVAFQLLQNLDRAFEVRKLNTSGQRRPPAKLQARLKLQRLVGKRRRFLRIAHDQRHGRQTRSHRRIRKIELISEAL